MAISSFILLLGTIAFQHQAKPSSLSPRPLFPGVHLSMPPSPSLHVAPSHQQVFHQLQWFSITSFITYLTPKPSLPPSKFSFWEAIASGMTHSANNLSDFGHPDSAMPLLYGNHQPLAGSDRRAHLTFPVVLRMALGLQHRGCCRKLRELIPLTCRQNLFFLKYSLLVTYYDNSALNSKSTKFNSHWTAHKNLNKVMSWRWGSCGWI